MQTLPDMPHSFIIPLRKIDVERRLVIGVAAREEPDKAREIMDYESSKAAFQAWSDAAYERSGGLSKGNLRAMHDPKSASGVIQELSFDDAEKRIEVCAKVVDDNDWKKCLAGVYTGFSIGGGYKRKWDDPMLKGYKRYEPRIAEMSLVDAPCMPSAKFCELVKADGAIEMLELRGRAPEILTFGDLMKRQPAPVPTFADLMAAQPMTFGELAKAQFGTIASPLAGGAAGAVIGGRLAGPVGALAGGAIGALGGEEAWVHHRMSVGKAKLAAKACPTCGQALPKAK